MTRFLPGTQKKLNMLTKAEIISVRVLYEKGKPMSKEDVWNFVGIGRSYDFANFSNLFKS